MKQPETMQLSSGIEVLGQLKEMKEHVSPILLRIVGNPVEQEKMSTICALFGDAIRSEIGPHLVPYALIHDLRLLGPNRPLLSILVMFSPLITIEQIMQAIRSIRIELKKDNNPILYVAFGDIEHEIDVIEYCKQQLQSASASPPDLESFMSVLKH